MNFDMKIFKRVEEKNDDMLLTKELCPYNDRVSKMCLGVINFVVWFISEQCLMFRYLCN